MTPPTRRAHGPTVRALRTATHRRLHDIAPAADVSIGFLSKIELGRESASAAVTARLAHALNVPVEALTGQRPALGELRHLLGIGHQDLARDVGVNEAQLDAIAAGAEAPRPELAETIARRLGVDVDALGFATPAAVAS